MTEIIPEAGHLPNVEVPGAFNDSLVRLRKATKDGKHSSSWTFKPKPTYATAYFVAFLAVTQSNHRRPPDWRVLELIRL